MAMEQNRRVSSPYLKTQPQAAPPLPAQGVQLFISSAWKDLPHAEKKGARCGGAEGEESRAGTGSWHSAEEGI